MTQRVVCQEKNDILEKNFDPYIIVSLTSFVMFLPFRPKSYFKLKLTACFIRATASALEGVSILM